MISRSKCVVLISTLLLFNSSTQIANAGISKSTFIDAISQLEVFQDEFKGNYEIYATSDVQNWTLDENGNYYSVEIDITKSDSKSQWKFNIVTFYWGEDWIFHRELNIKSSKGVMNLKLSSYNKKVNDDGTVTENSSATVSKVQSDKFCKILSGSNVIFRLRGSDGDVQGNVEEGSIYNNLLLCTVYQGLLQGYKPII